MHAVRGAVPEKVQCQQYTSVSTPLNCELVCMSVTSSQTDIQFYCFLHITTYIDGQKDNESILVVIYMHILVKYAEWVLEDREKSTWVFFPKTS